MATSETPGDARQRVWICCSERDHERARMLARSLKGAGFEAQGPWSIAAGEVRADEEARRLSDAHWVVVLACAELTAEERWPAQEALLRAHPRVVVVHLRPSLLRLEGAAVLKVKETDLDARVALRLQGPTAPAWQSYGEWVRRRHGWVTLWNLREEGAHGAGRAELEALYVAPVLKVAEASPKEVQAEEPEGKAQPKSKALTPEDLLDRKALCLLIRGEPGLGKSTLLRHLALRALKRPGLLPVCLSAAAAPRDETLVAHLDRELAAEDKQYRWLLRDALASGEVLLLVDALDEVASEARQALVKALQLLRDRYPQIRVVLTTRPEATSTATARGRRGAAGPASTSRASMTSCGPASGAC